MNYKNSPQQKYSFADCT